MRIYRFDHHNLLAQQVVIPDEFERSVEIIGRGVMRRSFNAANSDDFVFHFVNETKSRTLSRAPLMKVTVLADSFKCGPIVNTSEVEPSERRAVTRFSRRSPEEYE